ncbi:hypothetical protein ALC57_07617, partial [Trachymyrmex cornetzi]
KPVTLPCKHPWTFRMKGQALHSSRLRLKLRQHLTLANCLKYDLYFSYKIKFPKNTDAFSNLIGCPMCSSPYLYH